MKLWIITPKEGLQKENNPWIPWYDKLFGIVVRAPNEKLARLYATTEHGDEDWERDSSVWLDENLTDCSELTADGEQGVVIKDFNAA